MVVFSVFMLLFAAMLCLGGMADGGIGGNLVALAGVIVGCTAILLLGLSELRKRLDDVVVGLRPYGKGVDDSKRCDRCKIRNPWWLDECYKCSGPLQEPKPSTIEKLAHAAGATVRSTAGKVQQGRQARQAEKAVAQLRKITDDLRESSTIYYPKCEKPSPAESKNCTSCGYVLA